MPLSAEDGENLEDPSLIEEFGNYLASAMDWPRMAGRAAGALMLSERPMTLAELQHTLGASKGSVSETTRLLLTHGTVARFKEPGTRHFVYEWRDDAWIGCLQHQLDQTRELLALAEQAGSRVPRQRVPQHTRVRDMRAFYRFMVARLETLLADYTEHWQADRESGRAAERR